MASNIISVGSSLATSSEFTLLVGETSIVSLKTPSLTSLALVELKDDNNAFVKIDELTYNKPAGVLSAPGTYRVTRPAGNGSCGVFRA